MSREYFVALLLYLLVFPNQALAKTCDEAKEEAKKMKTKAQTDYGLCVMGCPPPGARGRLVCETACAGPRDLLMKTADDLIKFYCDDTTNSNNNSNSNNNNQQPGDPNDPFTHPGTSERQRPEDAAVCDPITQPPPHWRASGHHCLKSCGASGGTDPRPNPCSSYPDLEDVGLTWDVAYCCRKKGTSDLGNTGHQGTCDPISQPYPHWQTSSRGYCLPSCPAAGGTSGFEDPCVNHGLEEVGTPVWDVNYCCRERGTGPGNSHLRPGEGEDFKGPCKEDQKEPHWKNVGPKCLPSCGALYMKSKMKGKIHAFSDACANHNTSTSIFANLGPTWDVKYCCLEIRVDFERISRGSR